MYRMSHRVYLAAQACISLLVQIKDATHTAEFQKLIPAMLKVSPPLSKTALSVSLVLSFLSDPLLPHLSTCPSHQVLEWTVQNDDLLARSSLESFIDVRHSEHSYI